MVKVAINGMGRIGRAPLKIVMDTPGLDLVAANDLATSDNVVYLLKYDTVYGRYVKAVEATESGTLTVGEHRLQLNDGSRIHRQSGHRRLAAHALSKRPLRCREHRSYIHWCGCRDHQGVARISRQV